MNWSGMATRGTFVVAIAAAALLAFGFLNCSGPSGNFSSNLAGGALTNGTSQSNSQDTGVPGGLNPYLDPNVPQLNLNYTGPYTVNLIQAPPSDRIFQRDGTNHASFTVEGDVPSGPDAVSMAVQAIRIDPGPKFTVVAQSIYDLDINRHFIGSFTIPTGGSYALVFGALDINNNNVAKNNTIYPIGAGEVFLTAGGSNSTDCCGQSKQNTPPGDVHFQRGIVNISGNGDPGHLTWSSSIDINGGSPWPSFVTQLSANLTASNGGIEVPIAIVDLGCANSSSIDWTPGAINLPLVGAYNQNTHQYPLTTHSCGPDADGTSNTAGGLFNRVQKAAVLIGSFRAILWELGESDAANLYDTTNLPNYPYPQAPGDYYNHMKTLITTLSTNLSPMSITHFVADASYYPTTEVDPNTCLSTGEAGTNTTYIASIENDQSSLAVNGYALVGPNADGLWGTIPGTSSAYRYPGVGACANFSNAGLPLLGQAWYNAVLASGLYSE